MPKALQEVWEEKRRLHDRIKEFAAKVDKETRNPHTLSDLSPRPRNKLPKPASAYQERRRQTVPPKPSKHSRRNKVSFPWLEEGAREYAGAEGRNSHRNHEARIGRQERRGISAEPPDSTNLAETREGGAFLTGLLLPKTEILAVLRSQGLLLEPPNPLKRFPGGTIKGNPKEYCEYHGDYGHRVNTCFALDTELKRLLQDGKLDKYMGSRGDKRRLRAESWRHKRIGRRPY